MYAMANRFASLCPAQTGLLAHDSCGCAYGGMCCLLSQPLPGTSRPNIADGALGYAKHRRQRSASLATVADALNSSCVQLGRAWPLALRGHAVSFITWMTKAFSVMFPISPTTPSAGTSKLLFRPRHSEMVASMSSAGKDG